MVGSAERQHDIPRRKLVKENPRWARESDKAVISATYAKSCNNRSKLRAQLDQHLNMMVLPPCFCTRRGEHRPRSEALGRPPRMDRERFCERVLSHWLVKTVRFLVR